MSQVRCDIGFERLSGHETIVLRWIPAGTIRAQAVFLPAFGDEMNQSRRTVRLTAEALAEQGIASWVFDLYGTGDSSAGFEEATVERWLADCRVIVARMEGAREGQVRQDCPSARLPLLLIGCRLGVALAIEMSRALPEPAAALIGWAPLLKGKQQLGGMLRADKVAQMQKRDASGAPEPKTLWAAGESAWLGGYPISAMLAEQLELLDAAAAPNAVRVTLIDVRVSAADEPMWPAEVLKKYGTDWAAAGVATDVQAVRGVGFWNVADLIDVPELVEATLAAVDRALEQSQ